MKTKHTTDTDKIRIACRTIMAELDIPYGKTGTLSKAINVNRNQLSMALTGYRKSKRSLEILTQLQGHLKEIKLARANGKRSRESP